MENFIEELKNIYLCDSCNAIVNEILVIETISFSDIESQKCEFCDNVATTKKRAYPMTIEGFRLAGQRLGKVIAGTPSARIVVKPLSGSPEGSPKFDLQCTKCGRKWKHSDMNGRSCCGKYATAL